MAATFAWFVLVTLALCAYGAEENVATWTHLLVFVAVALGTVGCS